MNIKCPICRIEYESVRGKDSHLLNHGSRILAMELNKLLFRIHEQIAELEPIQPDENYKNSWDAEQWSLYDRMQVLKSLLEIER